MMKWRRAHSSAIEFYIGVPDSRSLFLVLKLRRVFHLRLALFLMA